MSVLPRPRLVIAATTVSPQVVGGLIGGAIGLAGIITGLWVNGARTERQRRRDLHARALDAVIRYGEMPFMIRRRRSEPEHRSSERVRLSERFSDVKTEVATCQVLLAADGDQRILSAYEELVVTARRVAGGEAHRAWEEEPVASDAEMNMPTLFASLQVFRTQLDAFEVALARATLPRRQRLIRWLRGTDLLHPRQPCL